MIDEKLKMLHEKVQYAQSCWSPRKRYEEALRSFRWVDGELDRLSPQKDSDVQNINSFAAGFHTVYGQLLRTIGMEEEGREHLEKAYDFHFGPLSHSFALHFELPIPDLLTAKRELLTDWKKQMDCLPYASVPYSVSESALRLADRLFEDGFDEEARETLLLLLDFVKEAERSRGGNLDSIMTYMMASQACDSIGMRQESLSYLEKAAQIVRRLEGEITEREKGNYDRAQWFEEAGAVFERLDPRKAVEYYDTAEAYYCKAVTGREYPDEYLGHFYDHEFYQQMGHLSTIFRHDIFARLALRRQRLIAVIDGEAGYPLRRGPREAGRHLRAHRGGDG